MTTIMPEYCDVIAHMFSEEHENDDADFKLCWFLEKLNNYFSKHY